MGCSRNDGRAIGNPMAPMSTAMAAAPDTGHGGGHPHPGGPPPPVPAVVFVSADSVFAADSSATRWQLDNDSSRPFTMPWTLTSVRNWPGFPKSGSVALAARGTQLLLVGVVVPETAAAGAAPLIMTVTTLKGTTESATGSIQVLGP
jgi:hypothetical protein